MNKIKPGAEGFRSLAEGDQFSGFAAKCVYLNHKGNPFGARFIHETGLPLDILYFSSVPQFSLYFNTLPSGDKGEPHALEHIVLGKGRKGKYFSTLMEMSLGEHTAATYPELTTYQFNTTGGMDDFFRLLESFLEILIAPDFTDEEIQREVYNLGVQPDPVSGLLAMEEKGTVYSEMVASSEKDSSNNWKQLSLMIYGKNHPLSYDSGGHPPEMRKMTPADIRAFHNRNYHIGPNMACIAALPPSECFDVFLKRMAAQIDKVEHSGLTAAGPAPSLPRPSPEEHGVIKIGSFPSDDMSSPQNVIIAWDSIPGLSMDDSIAISLLLEILGGGDSSYLHKDLVDRASKTILPEAAGISAFMDDPPANIPGFIISGVPRDDITPGKLEIFRGAVLKRVKWLAGLEEGSAALREAAGKGRSILSSRKRGMLKFMDSPPHFGDRNSTVAWHKHLDWLNQTGGFRKDLAQLSVIESLLSRLARNENIWKEIINSFPFETNPFMSAVKPDCPLLEKQKKDKEARLREGEAGLMLKYGLSTPAKALERLRDETLEKDRELEERDKTIPRPEFVKNPPLTLDDTIKTEEIIIARACPAVINDVGDSPFLDLGLHFDINGAVEEDFPWLPLLAASLTGLGVTTRGGEKLGYAEMIDRYRSEIFSLCAGTGSNPGKGRLELSLSASAAGENEIPAALEWLENCLFRGSLSVESISRLKDIITESTRGLRNITHHSEEYWVRDIAAAVVYQDYPAWMSLNSPFTELRLLESLRWVLEDPSSREAAAADSALVAISKSLENKGEKGTILELAEKLPPEMAEEFAWNLGHLPVETWREDFASLVNQTRRDLKKDPRDAIIKLKTLQAKLLSKENLRVYMTGNHEAMRGTIPLLETLINKLPVSETQNTSPLPILTPPCPVGKERVGGNKPLRADTVFSRVKSRYPLSGKPVHTALVNNGTKSGVFVISSPGGAYSDTSDEAVIQFLASRALSGGGEKSIFMKTWEAGLAYSNGLSSSLAAGKLLYYAERCPDLSETIKFVADTIRETRIDDPFFVKYALANSFNDYRGMEDFSTRGYAMANDLADGIRPEAVRKFKEKLIEMAGRPEILEEVKVRIRTVLGKIIPVVEGKLSDNPGTSDFVIGPDSMLDKYEKYLRQSGETGPLVKLYPRDFWLQ